MKQIRFTYWLMFTSLILFCMDISAFNIPSIWAQTDVTIQGRIDNLSNEQPSIMTLAALSSQQNIKQVSVGGSRTCTVTDRAGVKCWGVNGYSGNGNSSTIFSSTIPVDVSGLSSGVSMISVGQYHTCVVTSHGGVKCWGYNHDGQLGDGSTITRTTPVDVSGLSSNVTAIGAGGYLTCALVSNGGVKCWGDNRDGYLGTGSTITGTTPLDVSGLSTGVTAISVGDKHACALTSNNGVKCWGWNYFGQLGNGHTGVSTTPVDVTGLNTGVLAISTGAYHTCALVSSGGVKCWGYNRYGQLGNSSTTDSAIPTDVSGLSSGVTAISAGHDYTCALMSSGGVKCWGYNDSGQLGNGSRVDSAIPVDVSGLSSSVTAITAGVSSSHTCALTNSGGVKCWGSNFQGELGNDSIAFLSTTPIDVKFINVAFPSNLSATVMSSTQISLTWVDNSDNEAGFEIERCIGVDCNTFNQIATIAADISQYIDNGLSANTYSYRVRAYHEDGNSDYSNLSTATISSSAKIASSGTTVAAPGSRFIFNGSGFDSNQQLPVYLLQSTTQAVGAAVTPIGTVNTDGNGSFAITINTSVSTQEGVYALAVGETPQLSSNFTIDAATSLQQPLPQGITIEMPNTFNDHKVYLSIIIQ